MRDPGNAGWQRDLALSLQRIGSIAAERRDHEEARRTWQRGLAIMQRLTALAPGHAGFARDRAWFEERLARLDASSSPAGP